MHHGSVSNIAINAGTSAAVAITAAGAWSRTAGIAPVVLEGL